MSFRADGYLTHVEYGEELQRKRLHVQLDFAATTPQEYKRLCTLMMGRKKVRLTVELSPDQIEGPVIDVEALLPQPQIKEIGHARD